MNGKGFNPQKIFWITALLTLLSGILFFGVEVKLRIFGTEHVGKIVHAAAITSGILSMISFGYAYLKKGNYSQMLAFLHTLISIVLLVVMVYLNIQDNLISSGETNTSFTFDIRGVKVLLMAIWLMLQLVFFLSLWITKTKRNI